MSEPMRKIYYYEDLLEIKGSTSSLEPSDVKHWRLCRTCLSDEYCDDFGKIYVMGSDGTLLNIEDVVVAVTEQKFDSRHNRLPEVMCRVCVDKIAKLYYFKIQIQRAETVLHRLLKKFDKVGANEDFSQLQDLMHSSSTSDKKLITPQCNAQVASGTQNLLSQVNNILQKPLHDNEQVNTEDYVECGGVEEIEIEKIAETNSYDLDEEDPAKEVIEITDLNEDNEDTSDTDSADVMLQLEIFKVFQQNPNSEQNSTCTSKQSLYDEADNEVGDTDLEFKSEDSCPWTAKQPPKRKRSKSTQPLLENLACTVCQKSFAVQNDLIFHVQREHPKVKAYRCRDCGIMFTHVQSLSRHHRQHKTVQNRKVCDHCGKAFLRHDDWKRHVRVHTGERPYVCVLCEKSFKQQGELKAHHMTHAREKRFVCTICDHRMMSRNGLYLHMKAHKGLKNFICTSCEKRFLTNGQLKSHLRVHRSKK